MTHSILNTKFFKKEEFEAIYSKCAREINTILLCLILGFGAICFPITISGPPPEKHNKIAIFLVGLSLSMVFAMNYFQKIVQQRNGFLCPNCHARLFYNVRKVRHEGRCWKCCETIIEPTQSRMD
jgi:hypothetical protein